MGKSGRSDQTDNEALIGDAAANMVCHIVGKEAGLSAHWCDQLRQNELSDAGWCKFEGVTRTKDEIKRRSQHIEASFGRAVEKLNHNAMAAAGGWKTPGCRLFLATQLSEKAKKFKEYQDAGFKNYKAVQRKRALEKRQSATLRQRKRRSHGVTKKQIKRVGRG